MNFQPGLNSLLRWAGKRLAVFATADSIKRFERQKAVLEPLGAEVNTLVPLLDSTENQQRLAALGRLFEINQQLEAVMNEGRSDFSIIIFVGQLWTHVKAQLEKRKITNYSLQEVFFPRSFIEGQSQA